MAKVNIKKGFDIKIAGTAERQISELSDPKIVGLVPPDFRGIKVKLLKKEGEELKAGTAVYFDKNLPAVKYTSPVSGRIRNIEYGARRVIQSISIENDGKYVQETSRKFTEGDLQTITRDELQSIMTESGLWPHLRQRPFNKVANPAGAPKSIFISLFDTAPLAADPEYILQDRIDEFNIGLMLLQKFTEGKVNVTVKKGSPLAGKLSNCEVHEFSGPHPAGNIGIQIHHIDPIRRGDLVWHIKAQGLLNWVNYLLDGKYPSKKLIAVAGNGADKKQYFNVSEGMMIRDLLENAAFDREMRFISGDILSGAKRDNDDYIGYYDNLLTVIPEGRERKFLGWIAPGFNAFSFSKTFFSSLMPKKEYDLNTNTNGGPRAFVQTGLFEQVLPMDIYPDFLLKSILAEDIAEMEGLGIYEVSEEDFALCSFVDPSKNDVCAIIRQGLEIIEKEG